MDIALIVPSDCGAHAAPKMMAPERAKAWAHVPGARMAGREGLSGTSARDDKATLALLGWKGWEEGMASSTGLLTTLLPPCADESNDPCSS